MYIVYVSKERNNFRIYVGSMYYIVVMYIQYTFLYSKYTRFFIVRRFHDRSTSFGVTILDFQVLILRFNSISLLSLTILRF